MLLHFNLGISRVKSFYALNLFCSLNFLIRLILLSITIKSAHKHLFDRSTIVIHPWLSDIVKNFHFSLISIELRENITEIILKQNNVLFELK